MSVLNFYLQCCWLQCRSARAIDYRHLLFWKAGKIQVFRGKEEEIRRSKMWAMSVWWSIIEKLTFCQLIWSGRKFKIQWGQIFMVGVICNPLYLKLGLLFVWPGVQALWWSCMHYMFFLVLDPKDQTRQSCWTGPPGSVLPLLHAHLGACAEFPFWSSINVLAKSKRPHCPHIFCRAWVISFTFSHVKSGVGLPTAFTLRLTFSPQSTLTEESFSKNSGGLCTALWCTVRLH